MPFSSQFYSSILERRQKRRVENGGTKWYLLPWLLLDFNAPAFCFRHYEYPLDCFNILVCINGKSSDSSKIYSRSCSNCSHCLWYHYPTAILNNGSCKTSSLYR